MSKVTQEEKAILGRARKLRFSANGEPTETPQHPGFKAGSGGPIAERTALLTKGKRGKGKTSLSGPFDSVEAAASRGK